MIERSLVGLNVLAFALVLFVVLRQGGALRGFINEWQEARSLRRVLAATWPAMSARQARLDTGQAGVLLIEFSDYQCPYCKAVVGALDSLTTQRPEVGVVYVHFPLPAHASAAGAARAAICAEGEGRFRQMHDRLFHTTQWQSDTNWMREASAAGVRHLARFSSCLQSEATSNRLNGDIELGKRLGVTGTPTFVSRTTRSTGVQSWHQLSDMLRGED